MEKLSLMTEFDMTIAIESKIEPGMSYPQRGSKNGIMDIS